MKKEEINEKGENWGKFMKEMGTIGPMLSENMETKDSGIIGTNGDLEKINNDFEIFDKNGARYVDTKKQVSRAEKRKMDREKKKFDKRLGKAGTSREYLERMLKMDQSKTWLKDAKRVTEHKQDKINMWFDEELCMMLGAEKVEKIKKCVEKKGRMPLRYFYIKCKIQHQADPYPWGTDHLAITVFGQIHASVTYIWENK